MKKILAFAAAGIALAALPAAAADKPEVPKPKCEKPRLPGEMMRSDNTVMKHYNQDLEAWRSCMKGYIEERQQAMRANEEAANAAIQDYNDTVKALNEAAKS